MRKPKEFDCVEMKWRIQQLLLREEEELGREEARRRQWRRVAEDPILGPYLASLKSRQPRAQPTR